MRLSSPSLLLQICLLFLSLALGLTQSHPNCAAPDRGSTLQVIHVNSPCSPFRPKQPMSWEESVLQMQNKDNARLQFLSSLVARKPVLPIASGRQIIQSPTYIVRANFGTPAQTLLMAMDTSSDVAWIPCSGCLGCFSSTVYNFSASTTFKPVGCQAAQCRQVPNPTCGDEVCAFSLTYGRSTITAELSQDTITLANDAVSAYRFGCIQKVTGSSMPEQGLLGLGRGPMSLLSQTQLLYGSTFSYCLPSLKSPNFSGSLRLGPFGQPKWTKYTPLLNNPRRPSLYYVNLIGVRVGHRYVDIPPGSLDFNPSTGAGTIFDSGTVFTRLVEHAYIAVRDEFRTKVGRHLTVTSLGGFDTCYTEPIAAPTITFLFTGMNVTLAQDNLLIHSTAGSTTCLAMAATPGNVNVIASMMQQNHRLLFDVPNSRLGVATELCT